MRRNVRRTCAALACLGVAVTFLWSLVMPQLRGPDEFLHLDIVYEITTQHSYSTDTNYKLHKRIYNVLGYANHGDKGALHGLSSQALKRSQRPAFTDPPDTRAGANQLNQHPPLGWALPVIGSEVVSVVANPADWQYDKYLLLLRGFNALHMAVVGPLLFASALRLRARYSVAVFAALLPLAVPQAPYMSGVVSNDGMLLVVGALFAYMCARVATDDFSPGTGVRFGLVLALALLTKAWGLLLLPTAALLYGAQLVLHKSQRVKVAQAGLIALGTGSVLGGWWWVRNVVVEGALQPHHALFAPTPKLFIPTTHTYWLRRASSWLITRFWGWFGTFAERVRLPIWIVIVATAVAILLVIAGLIRAPRGQLLFGISAVGLFSVNSIEVLRQARALHVEHSGWQGLQGRYMFIGLPMLAIVAALGAQRMMGTRDRWLPTTGFVAMVVMQSFALFAALRAYWGPRGGSIAESLKALAKWQALGPFGMSIILGLLGMAFIGGAWVCRPAGNRYQSESTANGDA